MSIYERAIGRAGEAGLPARRTLRPRHVLKAIAVSIAKNALMAVPAIRAARLRAPRSAACLPTREGLATYCYDFLGEVSAATGPVAGKSILEIGPGDNLLACLGFLAAGARSCAVLDRFPGPYGSDTARSWYATLASDWARYSGDPWQTWLDHDSFPDCAPVETIDAGVEDARLPQTYDLVCSYVAAEHVRCAQAFADLTKRALAPDGAALHVIDFSGHEWGRHGDPFLFLKFPNWLWTLMGSNRGLPNRVRFGDYVRCFRRSGLTVDVVKRVVEPFDGHDPWVADRATPDFLTMRAVLRLTHH